MFLAHHELQVIYDDVVDVIHVDSVLHGVQNRPVNREQMERFDCCFDLHHKQMSIDVGYSRVFYYIKGYTITKQFF